MVSRIVPYQPLDLQEPAELVSAIRQRRGGQLINLDRMLLHSIPFAKGWNAFLKEVRENLHMDAQLRELSICVVAVLNGADYEFMHHAPVYVAAGGPQARMDMLRKLGAADFDDSIFTPIENEVIELTRAMTVSVKVPESIMISLQSQLGNSQLVELVGVIATYNMVSRFLVALQVTPEGH